MKPTSPLFLAVSAVLLSTLALESCKAEPLPAVADPVVDSSNFDFEEGLEGWSDKAALPMGKALPEAAHGGKTGLRVDDNDAKAGTNLFSAQMPAAPNREYALGFWAKTQVKDGAGVWARFYDAEHKGISAQPTLISALKTADGNWTKYETKVQSPEKAAYVGFYIHTYTAALCVFDFDDFSATSGGPVVMATGPVALPTPVACKTPAYIVLKVDDLIADGDKIDPKWQKFVDFIKARHIKACIGIIANSLEGDKPHYFQWIKDQQATGLFEFWNHGYDHKQWSEGGKPMQEFAGPSYEQQKQHLQKADALAREKLGFPFHTFGAPFNATDANTVKALAEEPDITIWLYGDLKTPAGKLVMDRVPTVNIEMPIFSPNVQKLAEGYNRLPDRDFFVIQGHASHWTDEGFDQFVQIIDYLTKAGAIFVTPSEYAQLREPVKD